MAEELAPSKAVVQQARLMHKAIGIEPTVERLKHGDWRITVANSRVVVTLDYKSKATGWHNSTLTVDGKPRKLARDLKHLANFFNKTDATLAESYVTIVVPEAADSSEAPPVLKHTYSILTHRTKKSGADVRLSRTESGGWRVGVYLGETRSIELVYARRGSKWVVGRIRLIIDNEDRSDEVHSIEEALRLFNAAGEQPKGRHQIGTPQSVKGKANSVQVRNTNVIRN